MKIKKRTLCLLTLFILVLILHLTDLSPVWAWGWYGEKVNKFYADYPGVPLLAIFTVALFGIFFANFKEKNIV